MEFITFKIAARSLLFYSKTSVNQIIIVTLLSAVITGSLFTGYSVKRNLEIRATEKLGNTDILISSGLRFFDATLADRISDRINEKATSLFETDGYIQNFSTGVTALNTKIYGISNNFFQFLGNDSLILSPGTVAINTRLAYHLGINPGDEIIIHFRDIDPLPANAPFAPSKDEDGSAVMKVGKILTDLQSGDFSLGISQIIPMNVFINIQDLETGNVRIHKTNRILIQNKNNLSDTTFSRVLSKILTINDIGLTIRKSAKTGEPELISDRIFIDSAIVNKVLERIPSAYPLLTYLANSIDAGGKSTPYSFITAIPPSGYTSIGEDEIIISSWLAKDIGAKIGDSLRLTWYNPGTGRLLAEKSINFIVSNTIEQSNRLSDPSLMPDFPGISGSTTCSGWDAGVPILMDKIREKDEDYWNSFRGTPKAFINYSDGRKLWGNNFGVATAIRFPESMNPEKISEELTGSIDPSKAGFKISDIRKESRNAASGGIDFSTLFLSLGIFIILSCIILLSLAVSMFFDSRKEQVRTYFALGFRKIFIRNIFLLESMFLSVTGTVPGVFLGYLINNLIIKALNSVWTGAVQTNTLSSHFGLLPLLTGFTITIIITFVLLVIKVRTFLKKLDNPGSEELHIHRVRLNLLFLIISFLTATIALIMSVVLRNSSVVLSFISGSSLFIAFVLSVRLYYIRNTGASDDKKHLKNYYSRKYYSFNPTQVITPVVFIAAGIFAVIITGANRQILNNKMLLPSGGTGGYLLWIESAVPVKEDMNLPSGRKEFGLYDPGLEDLKFVQAGKLSGDDASCLNLNHISSPPLLGINPENFILKGSFSFVTSLNTSESQNPWSLLNNNPGVNSIYGIADQTVLQWGLKIKTGDTLKYIAENGQPLYIIICGGLKSSVFQGNLIVGDSNLNKYFPSVAGNSVFLVDGNPELSDYYKDQLSERLSGYGASIETTGEKLSSFFEVTNTYLDVFTILGVFGMILGVAGMGFILIRNFSQRKREFAFMMATGYSLRQIRSLLLNDQIIILVCGILTGSISGLISTLSSLVSDSEIPWNIIIMMIITITVTGLGALLLSVRAVKSKSLVMQLRKE